MTTYTAADHARHAKARAQVANRQPVAIRNGYSLEYRPTKRVRGWPELSARPFALCTSEGAHLASFATFEALERALSARAGL